MTAVKGSRNTWSKSEAGNTNLRSKLDRGGSEEPHPQAGTRAYSGVRRGERRSDNGGIRMKANWYNTFPKGDV